MVGEWLAPCGALATGGVETHARDPSRRDHEHIDVLRGPVPILAGHEIGGSRREGDDATVCTDRGAAAGAITQLAGRIDDQRSCDSELPIPEQRLGPQLVRRLRDQTTDGIEQQVTAIGADARTEAVTVGRRPAGEQRFDREAARLEVEDVDVAPVVAVLRQQPRGRHERQESTVGTQAGRGTVRSRVRFGLRDGQCPARGRRRFRRRGDAGPQARDRSRIELPPGARPQSLPGSRDLTGDGPSGVDGATCLEGAIARDRHQ